MDGATRIQMSGQGECRTDYLRFGKRRFGEMHRPADVHWGEGQEAARTHRSITAPAGIPGRAPCARAVALTTEMMPSRYVETASPMTAEAADTVKAAMPR